MYGVFIKAILSGFMIAFGCIIYLMCPNKMVGALLFSFGLLTIVCRELYLFTGNAMLESAQDKNHHREDDKQPRTALLVRINRQVHHHSTSDGKDKETGDRIVQLGRYYTAYTFCDRKSGELDDGSYDIGSHKIT